MDASATASTLARAMPANAPGRPHTQASETAHTSWSAALAISSEAYRRSVVRTRVQTRAYVYTCSKTTAAANPRSTRARFGSATTNEATSGDRSERARLGKDEPERRTRHRLAPGLIATAGAEQLQL